MHHVEHAAIERDQRHQQQIGKRDPRQRDRKLAAIDKDHQQEARAGEQRERQGPLPTLAGDQRQQDERIVFEQPGDQADRV